MNPYRYAIHFIVKRLLWDAHPASWRSRKKLRSLKNKHAAEKAVILCNGPSLLDVDFSLLEDTFTIGLNKINLLFDEYKFRPSAIVAVNPYVIEQNRGFYSSTDIHLFLDAEASLRAKVKPSESSIFIHTADIPSFSTDCSFSIFQGYTVTYVAMQLAFHMGFNDVALVGCDHSFSVSGDESEVQVARGEDRSHFHKDYFADGQLWQLPDLHQSETYYKLANQFYKKSGRRIVNATAGGALEIFPRMDLERFLSSS